MSASVLVNGRFLARRITGVERYASQTLAQLGERVQVMQPPAAFQGAPGHAWEQLILPGRIPKGAVLWSPANTGPILVSNQVVTICDLSPLEHPEWFTPGFSSWYRLFWPILIRRARHIMTLSEYVRRKVIQRFHFPQKRVTAISAGVDTTHFHPQAIQPDADKTILFVGSLEPRKNLPVLLEAWGRIKSYHPDVTLLIAGARGRIFQNPNLPSDQKQVRFLNYIPEANLPGLYARASLFVLPSLDEGFGLPVLEAMACGTPVIAARRGALPETTGEAGLLFDPLAPDQLAELMNRCLLDGFLRQSLREAGLKRAAQFPWASTASQVWDALQKADET